MVHLFLPATMLVPHEVKERNFLLPPIQVTFTTTLKFTNFKKKGFIIEYPTYPSTTVGRAYQIGSSKSVIKVEIIRIKELQLSITEPHRSEEDKQSALVEISKDLRVTPFNPPDLGDVAYLGKPLKVFLKWLIENSSREELQSNIHLLDILCPLTLPTRREVYLLGEGVQELVIRSFANDLKAVQIQNELDGSYPVIGLSASISNTTSDIRDGRSFKISFNYSATKRRPGN